MTAVIIRPACMTNVDYIAIKLSNLFHHNRRTHCIQWPMPLHHHHRQRRAAAHLAVAPTVPPIHHRKRRILALIGASTGFLVIGAFNTAAAATLKPRIAQQRGFTRVVFDLEPTMNYRVETLGTALRLTISGAGAEAGINKVGNAEVSSYSAAQGSGNAVFTFLTPQGVSNRGGYRLSSLALPNGVSGQRLVLDFSGGFVDLSPIGPIAPLKLVALSSSVLLDAGHGGKDSGAIGYVTEEPLNLEVAGRVGKLLSDAGVSVSYTRTDHGAFSTNKATDLSTRVNLAKGKSLFVSIHANAIVPEKQRIHCGMEVYYFGGKTDTWYVAAGPAPLLLPPISIPPTTALPVAPPVTVELNNTPIGPEQPITPVAIPTSPASLLPSTAVIAPTIPGSLVDPTTIAPAPEASPIIEDSGSSMNGDTPTASSGGSFSAIPDNNLTTVNALLTPTVNPTPVNSAPVNPAPVNPAPVNSAPTTVNTSNPTNNSAPTVTTTPSPPLSKDASKVRQELSRLAAGKVLASMLGATAASNRGVKTAPFYVIKNATVPAILVEMGFVTHPVEGVALSNTHYIDRVAYGIARGIVEHLNESQIAAQSRSHGGQ
jgi:N-acetylmuramoyl-L-alanine amidase